MNLYTWLLNHGYKFYGVAHITSPGFEDSDVSIYYRYAQKDQESLPNATALLHAQAGRKIFIEFFNQKLLFEDIYHIYDSTARAIDGYLLCPIDPSETWNLELAKHQTELLSQIMGGN